MVFRSGGYPDTLIFVLGHFSFSGILRFPKICLFPGRDTISRAGPRRTLLVVFYKTRFWSPGPAAAAAGRSPILKKLAKILISKIQKNPGAPLPAKKGTANNKYL